VALAWLRAGTQGLNLRDWFRMRRATGYAIYPAHLDADLYFGLQIMHGRAMRPRQSGCGMAIAFPIVNSPGAHRETVEHFPAVHATADLERCCRLFLDMTPRL